MEKITINPSGFGGELKKSAYAEIERRISANREDARVLLFTGLGPGAEKTSTVAELAMYMAGKQRKVLLIDANMRMDKLTEILHPELPQGGKIYGLSDYLTGKKTMDSILCMTSKSGLCAVFSGGPVESPSLLLQDMLFPELISLGMRYFDFILIDCAPVDRYRDARIIGRAAEAAVPVIGWKKTDNRKVLQAMKIFDKIDLPVLGAVLADVPTDRSIMGRYYRDRIIY